MNVDYDKLKSYYKELIELLDDDLTVIALCRERLSDDDNARRRSKTFEPNQKKRKIKKSKTPVLDNFGRDLNVLAEKEN